LLEERKRWRMERRRNGGRVVVWMRRVKKRGERRQVSLSSLFTKLQRNAQKGSHIAT